MGLALEDNFEDVLGKAMRGLGMSGEVLAFLSGVSDEKIAQLLKGEAEQEALQQVAPPLGLDGESLVRLSEKEYLPSSVAMEGLRQISSSYEDMIVNAYVIWDVETREAMLFDTGSDATGLMKVVEEEGLRPRMLLLTHTHHDHIMDREKLITAYPEMLVWINAREACSGAQRFEAGKEFCSGSLKVETRLTWGHSPAGTSYVVEGLSKPVAIVGDAVFAGSMGGGVVDYQAALATNRAEIFTLPDKTVLCPGHGPMTTVGEEKANNPFFPEFK